MAYFLTKTTIYGSLCECNYTLLSRILTEKKKKLHQVRNVMIYSIINAKKNILKKKS
jgi:hypothetical protein